MKVKELLDIIYNEYFKVWEQLELKYHKENINYYMQYEVCFARFLIRYVNCNKFNSLIDVEEGIPFSMLYGLLEDFFDENNIIIETTYFAENWHFSINNYMYESADIKKTRNEIKECAILEACAMLDEKLNKDIYNGNM